MLTSQENSPPISSFDTLPWSVAQVPSITANRDLQNAMVVRQLSLQAENVPILFVTAQCLYWEGRVGKNEFFCFILFFIELLHTFLSSSLPLTHSFSGTA